MFRILNKTEWSDISELIIPLNSILLLQLVRTLSIRELDEEEILDGIVI